MDNNADLPIFIEIFNIQGQKIYSSSEYTTKFDLSDKVPGWSLVSFITNQKNLFLNLLMN